MKSCLFVIALVCAIFSFSTLAGPPTDKGCQEEQVFICHFDVLNQAWVKTLISGNAVESHFLNHDDGFPGLSTTKTSTGLDEDCSESGLPDCGDCLQSHGYGGCEVEACEALICEYDSFCCDSFWDTICADEAMNGEIDLTPCYGNLCQ